MKRVGVSAVWAVACIQGLALLSGCGGGGVSSGGGGGTTTPQPTISSFSPAAATIITGTSTTLTANFTNGTGVVTPGNISVTSGTAVTVNPTATTTYTLTVTGSSGTTPATQTATVAVDAVPTIGGFTPGAATIEAGTSTTLTATFANGTGVITPGNITVTSGTAVTVTPASTTTYTLTVTPPGLASAAITQTTMVAVDQAPAITSFTAGTATIEAGTSTTLTAVFTGGTGVVTPGNIPVVSGTAIPVSPTATTTYTLTVTPALGPAITATTAITVDPVPTITSFTANPTNVAPGSSSSLTAVFTGGTGVITAPGGYSSPATSGVAVSVTPSANTTYTLTVTPPVGTVTATQTVTVTVGTATITSFRASPTEIQSGTSTSLTGYFSGGNGVISGPGSFSANATSGTAVSVTPPTVTTQTVDTYTLTVTPAGGGTAATQTVTVTVDPLPVITSFTAATNPLVAGNSTSLTAVFSGGTGVITPGASGGSTGSISVTSGNPATVSPATTTTFTLTVTPGVGSAVTQTLNLTVYPSVSVCLSAACSGPQISNHLLGMNLAMWYDDITNATAIVNAFKTAGISAVRWPGGSNSDIYHWNGTATYPTVAAPTNCNGGYSVPDDTFTNFINDIVTPANLNLAVTADYGSDPACTGPGQASEAASWAAAAVAAGKPINYMTVGNEEYGSWEYDLHTPAANQHNPTVYASEIVGSSGFYQSIKAASPNTLVGVDVDADNAANGWDATVLGNAKGDYDFVEYHYYPQYSPPAVTSDTYLVHQAALDFTTNIKTLRSELATAGEPSTPIYVGEVGSNSANPGTQSWSITQGLYAGQLLGEAMNDGVARLTWWIGFGNCLGSASADGNNNASLYGWQNTWGAYNVFSDADPNCPGEGTIGTMNPTAEAFNLFQNVAVNGEYPQTTTVTGDTTDIRGYAATHGTGTALMLFNLNQTTAQTVSVALGSQSTSSDVQVTTYDKAIYDQTNASTPVWALPTTTDLGAQTLPLTITLQPWSINVVIVKP